MGEGDSSAAGRYLLQFRRPQQPTIAIFNDGSKDMYNEQCRDDVRKDIKAPRWRQNAYRDGHLIGYTSNCKTPEITFVCQDSYELVSTRCTLIFAATGSSADTWFDFDIDTLYLRWGDFLCYNAEDDDEEDDDGDDRNYGWTCIFDQFVGIYKPKDLVALSRKVKWLAHFKNKSSESDRKHASPNLVSAFLNRVKHLEHFTFGHRHHDKREVDTSPIHFYEPVDVKPCVAKCKLSPVIEIGVGWAWWMEPERLINRTSDEFDVGEFELVERKRIQHRENGYGILTFEQQIAMRNAFKGEFSYWRFHNIQKCREFNDDHEYEFRERGWEGCGSKETPNSYVWMNPNLMPASCLEQPLPLFRTNNCWSEILGSGYVLVCIPYDLELGIVYLSVGHGASRNTRVTNLLQPLQSMPQVNYLSNDAPGLGIAHHCSDAGITHHYWI